MIIFLGGVVIFATNSIIYLKQTLPSRGLPLNCYAKVSTSFPFSQSVQPFTIFLFVSIFIIPSFPRIGQEVPACGPLALDDCCASLLPSPDEVLVVARDGTAYILTLLLEKANNTVTELYLAKVCSVSVAQNVSLSY